jgi:hypothetical protein
MNADTSEAVINGTVGSATAISDWGTLRQLTCSVVKRAACLQEEEDLF